MASNEVRIVVTAEDNASKPIERISAGAVAGGVAVGTALTKMAEKALDMGRDMVMSFSEVGSQFFDMSAKTGMSVEALSALKFVAEQSGTSLDAIGIAAKKMNSAIYELGTGAVGAKENFAALGLSLADLQGKGVDESFAMITSRLADVGDKSTQSALAVKLFGKSGTDILPMLADGAAGLEAMKEKARELGLVMSTEAAMKADAVGDAMDALKAQMGGVAITIGAALAPAILNIANGLSALVSWLMQSKGALTALAVIFGGALIAGIVLFVSTIGLIPLAVGAAIVGIGVAIGFIVEHFDFLREKFDSTWELMKGPLTGFVQFMKPVINGIIEAIFAIPNAMIMAINKLASVVPGVKSVLEKVGIKGEIPKMSEMIGDLFGAVVDFVPKAAAAVSGGFKSLFTMPDLGPVKPKTGTFGGDGGGGDAENAAKKMADVMLGIAKVNNKALADAYMTGGMEQANIVRASQAQMMAAVDVAAAQMVIDLGITLPEATQIMFDKMQGQQVELAKAQEKIANDHMMAQIDAYMIGGQAAVDIVKQQQADTTVEVEKMAKGISKAFGIDIDAAMKIAANGADKVTSAMAEMGRQSVALAQQLWKTTTNTGQQAVLTRVADVMTKGTTSTGGLTPQAQAEVDAILEAANEATRKRTPVLAPVAPVVPTDLFGRVIIPNVSDEADGGIVQARPGGTLVRVGEGGQDEAIIPLGSRGGMGSTINIYLSGVITDPVATGQAVARALNAATAAVGPILSSRSVTT